MRAADWLVRGHAWPPGRLPPATDHPCPAATAARASTMHQQRIGGLLMALGDALLGQHVAQPRMLITHVIPSFLRLRVRVFRWIVRDK